jgi:hypothetical protein
MRILFVGIFPALASSFHNDFISISGGEQRFLIQLDMLHFCLFQLLLKKVTSEAFIDCSVLKDAKSYLAVGMAC